MTSLINDIRKALDKIDADAEKPEAAEPKAALLQELRDAAEAFDMDRVDKALDQLESFRYKKDGELIVWLREQVNAMDFEKIAQGEWLK